MLRDWLFRWWIRRLESENWVLRWKACRRLGQLGDARAVAPLIKRLGDRKPRVRRAACVALGALQATQAVGPLIKRLEDRKPGVRRAACVALGALQAPVAVASLITRSGDDYKGVRQAACAALIAIGPASVAPLIVCVGHWQAGVRQTVRAALIANDPASVARLIACTGNWWRAEVCQAACAALGALQAPEAVDLLIARLRDGNVRVRQAACRALASITAPLEPHLKQLWCRSCWARFERQSCSVGRLTSTHFVVCRLCRRVTEVVLNAKEAVAVLDTEMQQAFEQANGVAWGNWLQRKTLFDFDRVEIVQTNEYEVERLCVQVGNDTDTFRQPRYRRMRCTVDPRTVLSPSVLNMLKRTFGEVSVGPVTWLPEDSLR